MKIVCGDGSVDLDHINDFRPDNTHLYCQIVPAGYSNGINIPEERLGRYILTSDNGIINFEDVAFKLLFDMAIRFSLPNVKYIVNEMADGLRAKDIVDDGVIEVLSEMIDDNPLTVELCKRNIMHVHLRETSKIMSMNLDILSKYDMLKCINVCHPAYTDLEMNASKLPRESRKAYVFGYGDMIDMILDKVYVDPEKASFWSIYDALYTWFCSTDSINFRDFVNNFYEKLDKIIFIGYSKRVAIESHSDVPVPVVKSEEDTSESDDNDLNSESDNDVKAAKPTVMKSARINGSDITGMDETYTVNYCEGFYERDLKRADSEGYLEKLVISRVNDKAAPLDILNETIANKHSKDDPANTLRHNLANLRENAEEAVNNG